MMGPMMRGWRPLLAAALMALPAGGEPAAGVEFSLHFFAVHGRRQDTATYDFDGDGKGDLLNTSIDFDVHPHARWLAVYLQRKNAYHEKPDWVWAVSDRACALVFGDFLPGGGTEVGFIAEDGVYVYPYEKDAPSETPVKIIHARTFFTAPSLRQIPVWSWKQDLNGDPLDDLVLPLPDGYRVYFQTAPGVFGKTATLETAVSADGQLRTLGAHRFAAQPEVMPAHFASTVELPRVEAPDINGDGLRDLVTISGDTITIFFQKKEGSAYHPRPVRFVVPALQAEKKKDHVNLAMVKFVDIDADKAADLVVTKVEGQLGLWDSIKTSIYLHIGTGRGNFHSDNRIWIDGVSIDPEFIDMNGDGKLDAFTSRLRTAVVKQAAEAFIAGDIPIRYEVFEYSGNMFRKEPVYQREIFVARGDLEKTGMGAVPLVFVRGDLTGDGRPDLVHVDPKGKLLIHPGRVPFGAKEGIDFDGTAHHEIRLDRHPKGVHILDVNSDGINDVLLYYAGALGVAFSRRR